MRAAFLLLIPLLAAACAPTFTPDQFIDLVEEPHHIDLARTSPPLIWPSLSVESEPRGIIALTPDITLRGRFVHVDFPPDSQGVGTAFFKIDSGKHPALDRKLIRYIFPATPDSPRTGDRGTLIVNAKGELREAWRERTGTATKFRGPAPMISRDLPHPNPAQRDSLTPDVRVPSHFAPYHTHDASDTAFIPTPPMPTGYFCVVMYWPLVSQPSQFADKPGESWPSVIFPALSPAHGADLWQESALSVPTIVVWNLYFSIHPQPHFFTRTTPALVTARVVGIVQNPNPLSSHRAIDVLVQIDRGQIPASSSGLMRVPVYTEVLSYLQPDDSLTLYFNEFGELYAMQPQPGTRLRGSVQDSPPLTLNVK